MARAVFVAVKLAAVDVDTEADVAVGFTSAAVDGDAEGENGESVATGVVECTIAGDGSGRRRGDAGSVHVMPPCHFAVPLHESYPSTVI